VKMPFSRMGLIFLISVLALSVSACGSGEKGSDGSEVPEKITIGTDTSFVPFEFLNQDTGEYEGFDIDLVKAIAEKIGIEYELKPMDFNGLIPALQTGNLDMAIAGMTITDERKKWSISPALTMTRVCTSWSVPMRNRSRAWRI